MTFSSGYANQKTRYRGFQKIAPRRFLLLRNRRNHRVSKTQHIIIKILAEEHREGIYLQKQQLIKIFLASGKSLYFSDNAESNYASSGRNNPLLVTHYYSLSLC